MTQKLKIRIYKEGNKKYISTDEIAHVYRYVNKNSTDRHHVLKSIKIECARKKVDFLSISKQRINYQSKYKDKCDTLIDFDFARSTFHYLRSIAVLLDHEYEFIVIEIPVIASKNGNTIEKTHKSSLPEIEFAKKDKEINNKQIYVIDSGNVGSVFIDIIDKDSIIIIILSKGHNITNEFAALKRHGYNNVLIAEIPEGKPCKLTI